WRGGRGGGGGGGAGRRASRVRASRSQSAAATAAASALKTERRAGSTFVNPGRRAIHAHGSGTTRLPATQSAVPSEQNHASTSAATRKRASGRRRFRRAKRAALAVSGRPR